jgi:hypothetical protein
MEKTAAECRELEIERMVIRDGQLNIQFKSKSLAGFVLMRDLGQLIKRPVEAFGNAYTMSNDDTHAYMHITIPLNKDKYKNNCFSNDPPKRVKPKVVTRLLAPAAVKDVSI